MLFLEICGYSVAVANALPVIREKVDGVGETEMLAEAQTTTWRITRAKVKNGK